MDREERIGEIRRFRDLAESRLKTSVYGPESYGLIKVLIGHVDELLHILEPFPNGQFPAAEDIPNFGIDPWGFYTETTVPHFNVWDLPELVAGTHVLVDARTGEEVKPEPTAGWVSIGDGIREAVEAARAGGPPVTIGAGLTGIILHEEPTADEIHAHTKSCDFRRGLKVCSCLK